MLEIKKLLRIRNPDTKQFESLIAIKGEKGDKGEPGGLANITQELGDDDNLVISQKVITENINTLTSSIDSVTDSAAEALSMANNAKTLVDSLNGTSLKLAYGSYTGEGKTYKQLAFDFKPLLVQVTCDQVCTDYGPIATSYEIPILRLTWHDGLGGLTGTIRTMRAFSTDANGPFSIVHRDIDWVRGDNTIKFSVDDDSCLVDFLGAPYTYFAIGI